MIYTALESSICAIFIAYMSTTRIGLWSYAKVDLIIDFLSKKMGTYVFRNEDSWKYKYPMIRRKISEIENISKLENKTK